MRRHIEEAGRLESRHALHHPEHGDRANRVRRNQLGPARRAQRNSPNECNETQHNGDESNLSYFDADIEEGYAGRDSCA
jgi:hypothetical protein